MVTQDVVDIGIEMCYNEEAVKRVGRYEFPLGEDYTS